MFEAHVYSTEPPRLAAEHSLQPCEPVLCWHPAQQCNLAVWFTPASVMAGRSVLFTLNTAAGITATHQYKRK